MARNYPAAVDFAGGELQPVDIPREGLRFLQYVTVHIEVAGGASPTFSIMIGDRNAGSAAELIDLLTDQAPAAATAGYRAGWFSDQPTDIDSTTETVWILGRGFTGKAAVIVRSSDVASAPPAGEKSRSGTFYRPPVAKPVGGRT